MIYDRLYGNGPFGKMDLGINQNAQIYLKTINLTI